MVGKVLSMPPVLNSPGFWICIWFWMCQSFGYTKVLNMPLVLNMPWFWTYQSFEYVRVTQGSEYVWIIPEYAWICLIMSGYFWICLSMVEYAWICLNLLLYIFPLPHLSYNVPSPWTRGYLFEHLQETLEVMVWKNMRLSFWRNKICFFYSSCKYFICFCFRLNIFKSKFYISCYLSRPSGGRGGDWGPWILIHSSMVLFFLSQNL